MRSPIRPRGAVLVIAGALRALRSRRRPLQPVTSLADHRMLLPGRPPAARQLGRWNLFTGLSLQGQASIREAMKQRQLTADERTALPGTAQGA